MIYDKPLNCACGKRPKLGRKNVSDAKSPDDYYYYYYCKKCDISTFGTREEPSCRELWSATIVLKQAKSK